MATLLGRLAALINGWNSHHAPSVPHNGTRGGAPQHNGVRRLPVLRLPNGAHNPGVRLSNGTSSPPPLLSPRREKEQLRAKAKEEEDDRKPSLSLASDKANSPTWSITKMSQLDQDEAEDTRSTLSEKVLGETFKPLDEAEWLSCFPAPPSSPSNTSSSSSHHFLHEISPSPPPNFKHEASPSPPPDFCHEASTLPLSERHTRGDLAPPSTPHPDPHCIHHIPSPSPPLDFRGATTPTPHPNTPVVTPEINETQTSSQTSIITTIPADPQKNTPSPPPECSWVCINDLQQQHSSASSPAGSVASSANTTHRPSSGQDSSLTLSPAKLQYEPRYSTLSTFSPQVITTSAPTVPHTSPPLPETQYTSLAFVQEGEEEILSPSPPLPHFPDVDSSESPTHYDMQESDLSEHSQNSLTLMGKPSSPTSSVVLPHDDPNSKQPVSDPISSNTSMTPNSKSPPTTTATASPPKGSPSPQPTSERGAHEASIPPTPPPIPKFFDDDDDLPPTPPPIPKFFDAESPPSSPSPAAVVPQPKSPGEDTNGKPLPPAVPMRSEVPVRHSMLPPLDVIQESPHSESPNNSPLSESPNTISPLSESPNNNSPPPGPPFDIIHPDPITSPLPSSSPPEARGPPGSPTVVVRNESPPPPPHIDVQHRSPPRSPSAAEKRRKREEDEDEERRGRERRRREEDEEERRERERKKREEEEEEKKRKKKKEEEEKKKKDRPPSPEYFSLPDNWPAYPPFLFGDSDFPPP
ncbi:hypothetical protein Pmani_023023 [Petrolisthes manimaculis]|uniref:Uncharacterized protein n=1 Tax=Petrolisthes manimaculis TaxID=1843537 RepID=A0AAE1PCT0_9EUCA|nr:hypothetical protein Pmani_023023 [Petrolisthes manimaculis]